MTRIVVADTGPLIALARVEQLDLLRRQYRDVCVPEAVYSELAMDSGRPGATELKGAFEAGWITVQVAADVNAVAELTRLLDPGEAEAIVLAEEQRARFLLIDDARGRRVARRRGISVVGVGGVLLAAKAHGELAAAGPILDDLCGIGYRLSPRLIGAVLESAGE